MAVLKHVKLFLVQSVWTCCLHFFLRLIEQPACQTRKKENCALEIKIAQTFPFFPNPALCYILQFQASGTASLKCQKVIQVKENHLFLEDLVISGVLTDCDGNIPFLSLSQHLSHNIVILNIM